MESKDELKEIDIKNCTCYHFDHVIRFSDEGIDFSDILLDKKICKEKYENILIYDISYKTPTGAKPLRIRFDKIDRFVIIQDRIRYLVLSDYGWLDEICDKGKYLLSGKSGIADSQN